MHYLSFSIKLGISCLEFDKLVDHHVVLLREDSSDSQRFALDEVDCLRNYYWFHVPDLQVVVSLILLNFLLHHLLCFVVKDLF